jgi:hypothetical protein
MIEQTTCDSRQYRFAYPLQAASDVPGDFSISFPADGWLSAIFIPGDTEALWKPPEYPPRIYTLTHDTIMVYSHRTADDAPLEVSLHDLMAISTEKALLFGVIEFHAKYSSQAFRYNTLHQKHLNRFLCALRSVWLPPHGMWLPAISLSQATEGMTFRCWYALQAELDVDEELFGICCRTSIRPEKKGWFHRIPQALSAVLLAATNHRLIAISTGTGETDDLYGIVVRYAPTDNLKAAEINSSANGFELSLELKNGHDWKFLFEDNQRTSASCFLNLLGLLKPTMREVAADSLPPEELI